MVKIASFLAILFQIILGDLKRVEYVTSYKYHGRYSNLPHFLYSKVAKILYPEG